VVGILGLAVLGGAAFFLLGVRSPAPPVAVQAAPAARAAPAAPGPGEEPAAVPVRAVKGRVLKGAEGEVPFPEATVEAWSSDLLPPPGGPALGTARAGADGRFVLEGVPARALRVRAVAPGQAGASAKVEAEGGAEVTLRLVPAAWISGKVLEAEGRAPVAGAAVSWGRSSYAKSGPDGSFRLEPVPSGRAELEVRAKGFARARASFRVPEAGREGVEVLLRPGGSVAGTVLGPEGGPVPGAAVTASLLLEFPVVGEVPVPMEGLEAASGPDGKYLLEDVPCGRKIQVSARTPALLGEPAETDPLQKGEAREGVDVRLVQGAVIVATVLDGKGNPVAGASVRATPVGEDDGQRNTGFMRMSVRVGREPATTDASGVARVGPLKPGPMKVRASKDDYRDAEIPVLAKAGAEAPATLSLDPGASIAGRVSDPAGAPLAGAQVTVQRFAAGEAVHETRTSGEDGSFRVGGLKEGAFLVRGERKGFVTTSLNNVAAGTADLAVTLQPGGTVAGTVVGPDGKPVRKFRAAAIRKGDSPNPMDFQRAFLGEAGTEFEDPDGRFRLEGLEPGSFTVKGRAEGLAPGTVEGVAVEAGKETPVTVALSEGLTLSGVVVRKADGAALGGAKVKIPADGFLGEMDFGEMDLGPLEEAGQGGDEIDQARGLLSGMSKATAIAGPDGRFVLKGLEAGSVKVAVSSPGYAPAMVRSVEVGSGQDLRVEMADESSLEGTVTDAKGAPKQGAFVMLQRLPMFMRFASTDGQGHYRIGGVPAGSYLFYVMESPGMAAGLNLKSESVTLEEGKTGRKDYRMGEGTKVTGKVTRGGKAVDGVMVMLFPASRSGGPMGMLMGGGGGGFAMGSSREDGTYEVSGVAPGRYTVSVQGGMGGAPSGTETIEVARGATEVRHDVVLPENGIRGVVVDEEGKPVTGAAVTAAQAGKGSSKITDFGSAMESFGGQSFTDDEGRFSLQDLKAGDYDLRVQAQGYGTELLERVAAQAAGPEARIVLRKGIEVTVQVVGPDGAPVQGAALFLEDDQGREISNLSQFDAVRTGQDGRAVLRAPAGNLRFEAAARGFAPGEAASPVPASGDVVIRLRKGAAVKVAVKGADGAAVQGAGVEVQDAEGRPFGTRFSFEGIADLLGGASTGSDGTYVRRDLPAGTWKVRAVHADGRAGEGKAVLVEGETAEVAITVR
jgi:protocatechuate 3,4-dioxygenase beta subunit